jgi:hypothetical protein
VLVLRNERRGRTELDRVVGGWPGGGKHAGRSARLTAGSPAWRHAKAVWQGTRAQVGRARIEGDEDSALSVAFVEAVAKHAQGCRKCARPGALDSISAGQWLMWALSRVPATRAVLTPVLRQAAGVSVPKDGLGLPRPVQRTTHR